MMDLFPYRFYIQTTEAIKYPEKELTLRGITRYRVNKWNFLFLKNDSRPSDIDFGYEQLNKLFKVYGTIEWEDILSYSSSNYEYVGWFHSVRVVSLLKLNFPFVNLFIYGIPKQKYGYYIQDFFKYYSPPQYPTIELPIIDVIYIWDINKTDRENLDDLQKRYIYKRNRVYSNPSRNNTDDRKIRVGKYTISHSEPRPSYVYDSEID